MEFALITRRLVSILASALLLVITPAVAGAASCNGASHAPGLANGSVSPGSGTTTTVFVFSVSYSDTSGCAPNSIQVQIGGVGTFPMTTSGKDFRAGVTYTRAMELPLGTHGYSYSASSGFGAGLKQVTLTKVTPSQVQVSRPTRPPTAEPTSTSPPVASPAPSATALPDATGAGSPSSSASPSFASSGQATFDSPSPYADPGLAGPSSLPGPGGADRGATGLSLGSVRDWLPPIAVWLVTTAGGLGIFLLLLPRRRALAMQPMGPMQQLPPPPDFQPMRAEAVPAAPPPTVSAAVGSISSRQTSEKQVARWLRPSVQEGRQAGSGHAPQATSGRRSRPHPPDSPGEDV